MFENLIDRLESSFKILKGEGKITEINVAETLKDVRKALLDADVSYKIAKTFCDDVKKIAMGQDVLKAVKPSQMMVKIVHDELTKLMGSEATDINIKGASNIIIDDLETFDDKFTLPPSDVQTQRHLPEPQHIVP